MLLSWLKKLTRGGGRRAGRPKPAGHPPRNRACLRVEALEDRTVPTAVIVKTGADAGPDSLRDAIQRVNASTDTTNSITFQQGIFPQINLLTALPTISNNVTITGLGELALTVQRSSSPVVGKFRIFDIAQNKTVTISDLTIANGWAFIDVGGGVHNSGTLGLVNVIVDGNIADQTGGGVYNESGATLGVCNSSIYLNSAGSGGGIFNLGSATIECSSQIYSNAATDLGGGIDNDTSATMTITDSAQIYGNSATYGGGIFNKGTLSMDGGAISANSASKNGGGIYDEAGTATFSNLKINRNDAQKGGGLYAEGGTTTLDTCTVGGPNPGDHNTASVLGPGGSWPAGSTAPNLINCIINDAFDPDPNP